MASFLKNRNPNSDDFWTGIGEARITPEGVL